MRLTRQTNYAMRILMYCAANEDRLSRIPEIAAAYSVLRSCFCSRYCSRWSAWPRRNGAWPQWRRRLGRPAEQISLFNVVRVTEESFAMAECFENDAAECPLVDSCALNGALREALDAFFEVLARHSIADLVVANDMRGLLGIDLLPRPRALAG